MTALKVGDEVVVVTATPPTIGVVTEVDPSGYGVVQFGPGEDEWLTEIQPAECVSFAQWTGGLA